MEKLNPQNKQELGEDGKKAKAMNKAEIYQAVRKARLRSNYMNRDLSQ